MLPGKIRKLKPAETELKKPSTVEEIIAFQKKHGLIRMENGDQIQKRLGKNRTMH